MEPWQQLEKQYVDQGGLSQNLANIFFNFFFYALGCDDCLMAALNDSEFSWISQMC